MAREAFQVALGGLAGDFGGDGGDVLFGEEGERIGGGARREKRDGKENFEFRISNEKLRIELCWPILHSQFFIRNSKFTSGKAASDSSGRIGRDRRMRGSGAAQPPEEFRISNFE